MAIDLMWAFENEPPPLDFIWPGFLTGTVGALVAPGATGKSFWALEASMCIACSVAGGDILKLNPLNTGQVVYLAGEDPEALLLRRVHAIGKHLGPTAKAAIAENLVVESIVGKGLNIMDQRHMQSLLDFCRGSRLIIIDTLSRIHLLDENNNGEMAQLISRLEQVAYLTGASVLYLHHVNKGSAREGQTGQQQAARGASALVDNARWCGFVERMSVEKARVLSDRQFDRRPIGDDRRKHFIRFGTSKVNYAEEQDDRWYARQTEGVLVPAELVPARQENAKRERTASVYTG